tara:strand:+ start:248 stop:442 length:195 start_codon:yes stop_codon:yes gene_type:complete
MFSAPGWFHVEVHLHADDQSVADENRIDAAKVEIFAQLETVLQRAGNREESSFYSISRTLNEEK